MPKSRASIAVAMLLLVFGHGASLHAAVDMFLDIAGALGESTDPLHTNQVEVLAWSWGMSVSTQTNGTGKPSFHDLGVTKYVDKASPLLMLHCAKGSSTNKVTLHVRKEGVTPIEGIKIILTDVVVTSVSTGGSDGEDRLTENVSFNFAKVEFVYTPTKPGGSADTAFSFKWNIHDNSGTIISPVPGLTSTLTYTNGAPVAMLTWNSIAGVTYQIWATSDLNNPFQKYGGPTISAGNGTTAVVLPANAIRMFFRVETLSGE